MKLKKNCLSKCLCFAAFLCAGLMLCSCNDAAGNAGNKPQEIVVNKSTPTPTITITETTTPTDEPTVTPTYPPVSTLDRMIICVGTTTEEKSTKLLETPDNVSAITLEKDESVVHLPTFKIKSLQDLERFEERYKDSFDRNTNLTGFFSYDQTVGSLNEEFFENNYLILTYMIASKDGVTFSIDDLTFDNHKAIVSLSSLVEQDKMSEDIYGWFAVTPCAKSDIEELYKVDTIVVVNSINEEINEQLTEENSEVLEVENSNETQINE